MSTQVQTSKHGKVYVDLDGYDRIREHSPEHINAHVALDIEEHVREFGALQKGAISNRIQQLDREWDIDRALMLFFSFAASTVVVLGLTRNRKWLGMLGIQLPFLAYHAAVGWCPPMSVLRRLGFRSLKEIDAEKYALKTMRGDFRKPRAKRARAA